MIDVSEGDLIILVSDGIHDNLDPQTIGHTPKDCGLSLNNIIFPFIFFFSDVSSSTGLDHDSWDSVPQSSIHGAKIRYSEKFVAELITKNVDVCDAITPEGVVTRLIGVHLFVLSPSLSLRHIFDLS